MSFRHFLWCVLVVGIVPACAELQGVLKIAPTADQGKWDQAEQAKDYRYRYDVCIGKLRPPEHWNQIAACVEPIEWARDAGDLAFVDTACNEVRAAAKNRVGLGNDPRASSNDFVGQPPPDPEQTLACRTAKGAGSVAALVADSCDGIGDKIWAEVGLDKPMTDRNINLLAKKLLDCGDWGTLFNKLASRRSMDQIDRSSQGYRVLKTLSDAGADVKGGFATYLKTPAPAFDRNLGFWLVDIKANDLCAPVARALEPADKSTKALMLHYFSAMGCPEGAALGLAVLSAGDPLNRQIGCWSLSTLGTKHELPNVKTVASSDPYYITQNGAVVYPVRIECEGAAGQIQLRGK